jgi:hypothetical protein
MMGVNRNWGVQIVLGLLILPLLCLSTSAQVTTATIEGLVLDPGGLGVPGAEVSLLNQNTGLRRSTVSEERGQFTFTLLPPGVYTVGIEMPGFKSYREVDLPLVVGQRLRRNFRLDLGEVTETVTVMSETPLLRTGSAEESFDLTAFELKELPVLRRDITNILSLGTGVTSQRDVGVSLHGLPPRGFLFTIDGINAAGDPELRSLGMYQDFNIVKGVSLEAVEQVQVAKGIMSADVANAVGGNVNLITKGGTNDYRGSVFWNYQTGGLNARYQFAPEPESLVFHQFGGSVGGPIKKDSMFFFGAFEGYRLTSEQSVTAVFPTQVYRDQIVAANPEMRTALQLLPLPTDPTDPGALTGRYRGRHARTERENHSVVRWDWNATAENLFSARYKRGRPNTSTPRAVPENPQLYIGVDESIVASFIHSRSTWTSETRGGYNYADIDRIDNLYNVGVTTFSDPSFSFGPRRLFGKEGSTTTIDQNFSLIRGRHTLKFGGTYQLTKVGRVDEETPNYAYASAADLFAGSPLSASYRFRVEPWWMTASQVGGFIHDDIKVSPKLILNVGLRYDYYGVPRERDNRMFNRDGPGGDYRPPDSAWNASYKDVSPRIGLAYTFGDSGKTVIRTGYGIYFSRQNLFSGPVEIVKNLDPTLPVTATFSRAELSAYGLNYPDGNSVAQEYLTASPLKADLTIDPNWRNPYSQQWTLGIQRQLSGTMAWDVAYVGNHALRLPYSPNWNIIDRETGLRPIQGFGQFAYYQSADSSTYNALQTSLNKRFSRGLAYDVSYTYSSNMAYFRGDMHCCGAAEAPQDLNDLAANKGPTTFHIRHRFSTNWIYQLPFERLLDSNNRIARLLVNGWQIGGVLTAQSGQSFNLSQTSAVLARPDVVKPNEVYVTNWRSGGLQYLNREAFEPVPLHPVTRAAIRPGNVGHRAHFFPGWSSWDLSLSKSFGITENVNMQFRVDAFNAFNSTHFSSIQTSVNHGEFGRFTASRGARVVQLNFRLVF